MSLKDNVIEAQRMIIDGLANCEEHISILYSIYGDIFPDHADFWKDLAKKEEVHTKMLKGMHKQLDQGNIFQNIGRFSLASIEEFLAKINGHIEKAKSKDVAILQAVETALSIESSVLDTHFYDVVNLDSHEYKIIADRLSNDTQDHVKAVRDKLMEIHGSRE